MKCLGANIYGVGDTTLEEHVIALLKAQGETLALAEIGSDGALTAALNVAAEAHQVITGAYVAPTEAALRRLVSGRDEVTSDGVFTISDMARRTADVTGSAWVLVTGPVRQAEGRGRYLEVALRGADGRVDGWRESVRGSAEMVGARVCTSLLDQLRRRLRGAVSKAVGRFGPRGFRAGRRRAVADGTQQTAQPDEDAPGGQDLAADDAEKDPTEAGQV